MADFDYALTQLLKVEGGYANDPRDPGGETYKGISRVFWPNWSGWPLIDAAKSAPKFHERLSENEHAINDCDAESLLSELRAQQAYHYATHAKPVFLLGLLRRAVK